MAASVEVELDLPRDASAAARARAALMRALPDDLSLRSRNDLLLVVSELVGNAVEHGQGAIRLRLRLVGGRVAGEVIDEGHGFERTVRRAGADAIRGRGLLLVDALSSRWGLHEGTTHVWFEMDLGSPPDSMSGPALGEDERPPELPDPD